MQQYDYNIRQIPNGLYMAEPFCCCSDKYSGVFKNMFTLQHLIQLLSPLLETMILLFPFQRETQHSSYTTSDQLL